MKVTLWKVGDLKPYPNNPRQNEKSIEAVADSIKEFGFRQPIVVDENATIICGHTRFYAAQLLKLDRVPVHVAAGLTPEQIRAYRIADNQTATLSRWDEKLLAFEVSGLKEAGYDLSHLAFKSGELSAMLSGGKAGLTEPDAVPAKPKKAITQLGDLWTLGTHRVLCGDSTRGADVEQLFDGAKADMLLTDPPYGVSYVGKTKDALTIKNDDLDEERLAGVLCGVFEIAVNVCRGGAYWYATVPAGPMHLVFAEDWKRRGVLRQIMVWAKDSMVLGHSEYHYQHEPILFGWLPGGKRHKNSDRTRTTLWQYDRPKASREHPTMKPVALWAQAIKDGSHVGELVYDPFVGSGTSIIAAEQLDRRCFAMEMEPEYCDVVVQRWEQFTGRKAERHGAKTETDDATHPQRKPKQAAGKRSGRGTAAARGRAGLSSAP